MHSCFSIFHLFENKSLDGANKDLALCAALRVFAVPRLRSIPVLKANAKVFFSHTFINNRGSNALLSEHVHVLSECVTIRNAQERDDVLLRQQSVTHFHDWP